MSLILVIMIINNFEKKDIIFASDGRAITYENDKKLSQNEDAEKIRILTPKICVGYVGKNSLLFEDVYRELKKKVPEMRRKDLESVSDELKKTILKKLNVEKHKEVEDKFGPLVHKFVIGGVNKNNKLRLNYYYSENRFKKIKHKFNPKTGLEYLPLCPDANVTQKVDAILNEKKDQMKNFAEIGKVIRYAISKTAELHPSINNHIFIRRLSRNFDLEKYIGY